MRVNVALGQNLTHNASSRRKAAIPGAPGFRYSETSFARSKAEEDAIRNSFKDIPGIDPLMAETLAEEALAKDPHYGALDAELKYGGSTPSSSFIQAVDISPALGMATLTLKNGRSYSYPVSSDQAGQLINSDSLGRWYNANMKLRKGGPGAATIGAMPNGEVVGRSVAQTLSSMNPSVVSKAGLNVANQIKRGVPASAIMPRAALGGSALGGIGAVIISEILNQAAKHLK